MLDDRFDPTPRQRQHGPSNGGPAGKFSRRADTPKAAPRMPGPPHPEPPVPAVARPRLELSLTQILGSTGAAVTAAFLGSRLGVAGTLIGAALASVISVVGGAVYTTSIKATRHRVAQAIVAVRGQDEEGGPESVPTVLMPVVPVQPPAVVGVSADGARQNTASARRARPLLRGVLVGAALSAVVFAAALTLVTGYESVSGTALAGQAGGLTVLGGAADRPRTGASKVTPTSTPGGGSDSTRTSGSAAPTTATSERTTGPAVGTSKPAAGGGTIGPVKTPTKAEKTTAPPRTTGPTAAPTTTDAAPSSTQDLPSPPSTPETSAPSTTASRIATDPATAGPSAEPR
jgi:hypothetical protein